MLYTLVTYTYNVKLQHQKQHNFEGRNTCYVTISRTWNYTTQKYYIALFIYDKS